MCLRQGVNTLKIAHLLTVLSVLVFIIALLESHSGHEQMLAALPISGKGCSAQYFPVTRILGSYHSIITKYLPEPKGVSILSERNSQSGK